MKIKKHRRWKRIDRWLQTAIIAMSIIIVGGLVSGQTITSLTLGILKLDNNATITSGQVRLPDGSQTAPSSTFTSDPTTGAFFSAGPYFTITVGGVQQIRFGTGGFIQMLNAAPGASRLTFFETVLRRDNANILAQINGNEDQAQRWYGANGAYFQVATQSELLTILAAASTPTAMTIPANAVVRGVAVYVVTVIPTAATFTVTGTASGTAFNTAAVGTAAGSNDVGTQNTPYKNGAAQTITITPNLPPLAATGQVRVVLMYEIPSPPTS